jgi:hypothetical protein
MIKLDPYEYYLGVYRRCRYDIGRLRNLYPGIVVAAETPRKSILSMRQLKAAAINYIETLYIDGWIRNPDLRFLAFIFRETQIKKIIEMLEGEDKVLIILSRDRIDLGDICTEYSIEDMKDEDIDFISELAIFRARLEKER